MMTKYYRVRTPEQWDWLKNKLEIEDDSHVSNFPVTILYGDVICGIYKYHDDPEPLIEVSQMMEDSRMKVEGESMTEIVLDDLDQVNHGVRFENGKKIKFVTLPTSKLYPKVPMTEAEKKEFDKLKDEMSLDRHDLDDLLTRIKDSEDFPFLYHRLYVADGDGVESQLEFARAWVDPSIIEVVKEKKFNVKVPISKGRDYYEKYSTVKEDNLVIVGTLDSLRELLTNTKFQFTEAELKQYGLDSDMYEKVEVKE